MRLTKAMKQSRVAERCIGPDGEAVCHVVTLGEALKANGVKPAQSSSDTMTARRWRRSGIIRHFGQWAVTDYGLENLSGPCRYEIPVVALGHPWWSDQMADKNWVNRADFDAALGFASEHFGITVATGVLR